VNWLAQDDTYPYSRVYAIQTAYGNGAGGSDEPALLSSVR
jgi:hypothetical protein